MRMGGVCLPQLRPGDPRLPQSLTKELPLKEVPVGARAARSYYSAEGRLLHTAGFVLTASALSRLTGQNVETIELFEGEPEIDIEGTIREVVSKAITLDVALDSPSTSLDLPEVFSAKAITERIENSPVLRGMEHVPESIQELRDPLLKAIETNHMLLTSLPRNAYDEVEIGYQLDAAIIALALGTVFEYPERDQRVLASAALLQNAGRIIFASAKTGSEELKQLIQREHPAFSASLLRGCVPDQLDIESAILQHEERFDGSGSPLGLRGVDSEPGVLRKSQEGRMDRFSEILIVANAFAAHRLGLSEYEAASELEVITFILQSAEILFNPILVQELSSLIQRFPVGAPVRILSTSSGRYTGFTGVVRATSEESEAVPVKSILLTRNAKGQQIKPMEVELGEERRVKFLLAETL